MKTVQRSDPSSKAQKPSQRTHTEEYSEEFNQIFRKKTAVEQSLTSLISKEHPRLTTQVAKRKKTVSTSSGKTKIPEQSKLMWSSQFLEFSSDKMNTNGKKPRSNSDSDSESISKRSREGEGSQGDDIDAISAASQSPAYSVLEDDAIGNVNENSAAQAAGNVAGGNNSHDFAASIDKHRANSRDFAVRIEKHLANAANDQRGLEYWEAKLYRERQRVSPAESVTSMYNSQPLFGLPRRSNIAGGSLSNIPMGTENSEIDNMSSRLRDF